MGRLLHVRGWENLLAGLKNWILPKTHLSTNKLIFFFVLHFHLRKMSVVRVIPLSLFNCQNGKNICLNYQNCPELSKLSKNAKIVKKCQNCQKMSKIVKNCRKLSKIVKIFKNCQNCQNCKNNCQNVGQVMFLHHSDQMSQRSQVSRVAL